MTEPLHVETINELAERWRVSKRTIRNLMDQGLPSRKIGGSRRFLSHESDEWMLGQTRVTADPTVNASYVHITDGVVVRHEECLGGSVILDVAEDGKLIGVEILGSARRLPGEMVDPHPERTLKVKPPTY